MTFDTEQTLRHHILISFALLALGGIIAHLLKSNFIFKGMYSTSVHVHV